MNHFETPDTALATFLYASGVHFQSADHSDPRRVVFLFDTPPPELLSGWQAGSATVNARAYHQAYQYFKKLLFGGE